MYAFLKFYLRINIIKESQGKKNQTIVSKTKKLQPAQNWLKKPKNLHFVDFTVSMHLYKI